MQSRPEQPERDVWFIYSRRSGKVSAAPANAKGWLALVVCIAATVLVGRGVSGWAVALHPVFGFLVPMGVTAAAVLLTIRLAIAKGKQAN